MGAFGKKGLRAQKGQTSIEILSIAIVMAALLLIVLVSSYVRNGQTQDMLVFNSTTSQCSEMSSVIARLYSNRAVAKEALRLEHEANFLRVEGKPGSISVGEVSCFYVGTVSYGALDDTDGIGLAKGEWCFGKSDGEIVLSGGQCS